MKKQLDQLIEWHTKFEVPFNTKPVISIPDDLAKLRYRIMKEEVQEWYEDAINEFVGPERRAKELADILYTVFGTIITEGLQDYIEQAFDEVHNSNMSKLDENGRPVKRVDGKVLKSELYKEPDLSFIKVVDEE